MNLGTLHVRFNPADFSLQRFDAGAKLVHRHWIEILLAKLDQRIARLAGEEVFQVHGRNR